MFCGILLDKQYSEPPKKKSKLKMAYFNDTLSFKTILMNF